MKINSTIEGIQKRSHLGIVDHNKIAIRVVAPTTVSEVHPVCFARVSHLMRIDADNGNLVIPITVFCQAIDNMARQEAPNICPWVLHHSELWINSSKTSCCVKDMTNRKEWRLVVCDSLERDL